MVRRWFGALLLAVLLAGCLLPAAAWAADKVTADVFLWDFLVLPDGTLRITGYNAEPVPGNLVFPSSLAGMPVSEIDIYLGYRPRNSLVSVVVPEPVRKINALGGAALRTVQLPDTLEEIPDYCFSDCSKLRSIELPASLRSIGYKAFYGCTSLTRIDLPDRLERIADRAFAGCTSLGEVTYGDALKEVGWDAFAEVPAETAPAVTAQAVTVQDVTEQDVTSARTVRLDGLIFRCYDDHAELHSVLDRSSFHKTELVIPDTVDGLPVTAICDSVFKDQTSLQAVTLPQGLTSIGSYAFENTQLTEIVLPKGLRSLGEYAFCGAPLTAATIPSTLEDAGGAFADCPKLKTVTLAEGLRIIDGGMFSGCTALRELSLPQSLLLIDESAFNGCTALRELTLPEGLMSIGEYAFYACDLRSVDVPQGVRVIPRAAFSDNKRLTHVTLGEDVLVIGERAFRYTAIKRLDLPKSLVATDRDFLPNTVTSIVLPEDLALASIYMGKKLRDVTFMGYQLPRWVEDSRNDIFYTIDHSLFEHLKKVTCYKGSQADVEVQKLRARKRTKAKLVYLKPDPKTETAPADPVLAAELYKGRCDITELIVPEGVTEIGAEAFLGMRALERVTLPSTLRVVGREAFMFCASLKELVLPESLTEIGVKAFYGCTRLNKIAVPEGVSEIREMTFGNCTSLSDLTLSTGLKRINKEAFWSTGLKAVVVPDGVEYIGEMAFEHCRSLSKITLPPSVTTLGDFMLGGSNNYKPITVICEKGSAVDSYFKNVTSLFWKVKLKYKKWK